jgi:hypothetical protein
MEEDDSSVQDLAAEFDSIDCPSWINFDEENYEPRFDDRKYDYLIFHLNLFLMQYTIIMA